MSLGSAACFVTRFEAVRQGKVRQSSNVANRGRIHICVLSWLIHGARKGQFYNALSIQNILITSFILGHKEGKELTFPEYQSTVGNDRRTDKIFSPS